MESLEQKKLRNLLDYPDIAFIACPKPMLSYNGEKNGLFPLEGVRRAYERMHRVWASQETDEKLVTKLRDVPHVFNQDMQGEAFAWLDRQMLSR
jgi:hypothetical protein